MKLIKNLSLALALLVFGVSCQKELTDPAAGGGGTAVDYKVRKYSERASGVSGSSYQAFLLNYDGQDRLLTMVDSADAGNKFVYSYGTGTYAFDLYAAGTIIVHLDHYLNSIPYIDSTVQSSVFGDTTTEKWIYDGSNHISQIKDYTVSGGVSMSDGVWQYTTDANGNVTAESNATTGEQTTYTYTTELNTINVGKPYEPTFHNLPLRSIYSDGAVSDTIDYSYTFDALHRVSTQTEVSSTGNTVIKTYSY